MSLQPGARLGPYEVVALLGTGGMGEVYRGRDPRLARDIAIKVLPTAVTADPDRLHRFEQEAKAAAALNHPNILAVYDIGQHNGSPYIVSELLEGQTLRAHLTNASAVAQTGGQHPSQRRLPARKAVDFALQMVRGLSAAHDKGITHRDLKPENVFLTADGQLKILDFGLAKLAEPAAASIDAQTPTVGGATGPGVVLGTIGYMSPEQVRGQTADHRSDLFAFGAPFYEMLSGHRAFAGGSSADTMTAILNEHPPALSDTDPELAPGLARIVERCLEKSQSARFQSTHDLGFALEGLSTHSGVGKQSNVTGRRSVSWLPWAVAAVVTFLFVAMSILAARYYGRLGEALPPCVFRSKRHRTPRLLTPPSRIRSRSRPMGVTWRSPPRMHPERR
jgi:eukaryotic-like serine/threonine-protein kinase